MSENGRTRRRKQGSPGDSVDRELQVHRASRIRAGVRRALDKAAAITDHGGRISAARRSTKTPVPPPARRGGSPQSRGG